MFSKASFSSLFFDMITATEEKINFANVNSDYH